MTAISSKDLLCSRQSRIAGYDVQSHSIFLAGTLFHNMQRRSEA
jgi:hypothetical protein